MSITANDNLHLCATLAKSKLYVTGEPSFEKLVEAGEVSLADGRETVLPLPYDRVLSRLNKLRGKKGFVYSNYSPGGTSGKKWIRKYLTDKNAQRIDAVRSTIASWSDQELLSEAEEALLVSDLLLAVSRVSNTAGTYGFFLDHWADGRHAKPLLLERSVLSRAGTGHQVHWGDASTIVKGIRPDVLYLDPPYTWRHYGAYYHLLETISRGDEPEVIGKSGLRPWNDTRSPFCYPAEASQALGQLVRDARADHIFLSYNSEGLISHETIIEILSTRGEVTFSEAAHQRYRSNSFKKAESKVVERLYHVQCT